MSDIDTVVNRIRKLMALTAERGASEAEAALAAEHVQRLLAEHNLSMSSVEASGASSGDDGKRVKEEGVGSRQVYKWQRELMSAVAKLNYCKAFARLYSRGWNRAATFDGYDLIGRASNVATTKAMFEYLLQTIERLARDDVKDPTKYFTRYAHSFKEGCSDRLIERLEDKQEQILAEQEQKVKEETVRRRHPGAASSNLPAVVLRDVVQTENDLNNDLDEGWAPGTTAKNRETYERERDAEHANYEIKKNELVKAGYHPDVADYMSRGWSEARAYEFVYPKEEKPETDAQRAKRERRETNDWYRERQRREREAARLDPTGYRKGRESGNNVGLDKQVDRSTRGRIG